MDVETLEGVALQTLRQFGFNDSVDAFDLAHELRIKWEWTGSTSYRFRERVYLSNAGRATRVQSQLTHEIAHILFDRHGLRQNERHVKYLGAALLGPRVVIGRQISGGIDLEHLRNRHVNASAELLARRVAEIGGASMSLYDQGRERYRLGPPLPRGMVRQLVDDVLTFEHPVRLDDRTGAWPVMDGRWRRVIVLSGCC